MAGFTFNPAPVVYWWSALTPRFDAYAAPAGCRVWKIDPRDTTKPSQVMIDQVAPYKTYMDKRHLDVWALRRSADNGGLPTWFVVYQPSDTEWWVCLSGETTEKPT